MQPQDAEFLGAVRAKSGEHGLQALAVVLHSQLHQGSEGRGWFELVRFDQAAQRLSRTRSSGSGQESCAFADEELAFSAVECFPIRPCQANAMTRRKRADHAGATYGGAFDYIAMVLPMDWQTLVERSKDFRESHHAENIEAHTHFCYSTPVLRKLPWR